MSQSSSGTRIFQSLLAVLIGALVTSHYYRDEAGPIEGLKNRLSLLTLLLVASVVFDVVIVGVIWYG